MEQFQTISTRLIKPTQPDIDLGEVLRIQAEWGSEEIQHLMPSMYDEECAQFLLANDEKSHHKFYAALLRGEPTLKCRMVLKEPENLVENQVKGRENTLNIITKSNKPLSLEETKHLEKLMDVLSKRGYRFQKTNLISVCEKKIAQL